MQWARGGKRVKTFRAMVCQMCGNYFKTKYEIMKHYKKRSYTFFFIPNPRSWDFKPLLEKAKPTLVDSSSDEPKALIQNVGSQPLTSYKEIKVNSVAENKRNFQSLMLPLSACKLSFS